jgi:hypothetical protein
MITIIKLIHSNLPKIIIVYDRIKIINIYINNSYNEILQDYINIYEIKNNEAITDFFIFGDINIEIIKILTSIAHFNIKNIKIMTQITPASPQQAQTPQTPASPQQVKTPAPPQMRDVRLPNRFFNNDKMHKTVYLADSPLNLGEYEIKQDKYNYPIEEIKKDVNKIKIKIKNKQIIFPKINLNKTKHEDLKKLKNFIYATTNKRYNKHTIGNFINLYQKN